VVVVSACSRGASRDDCKLVLDDPAKAMVRVTERYPRDPVKVAETIERCVAPTGDECERIHTIVQAIPSMMGSAAASSLPSLEICRTSMTPEMRRCMLPSYVLAHAEECMRVLQQMAATTIDEMPIKPRIAPPQASDCDGPRLTIEDDGMTLTTGPKDKRVTTHHDSPSDLAWLEERIKTEKAALPTCGALELWGARGVRYQEVIAAMDVAVKAGFTAVQLDDGAGDLPDLPGPAPGRPGPDALNKAPVLIITKQEMTLGATTIARTAEIADGPEVIEALTRALPPPVDRMVIVQADESTDMIVITRAIGTLRRAGYDNVLFAVKNK
jgi:biopolymer transport protein ExbD